MMFVYFGYMLPLSTRITRGLYADGVWTDTGFMPLRPGRRHHLAGRRPADAGRDLALKTAARGASRCPRPLLGEVRRVLRDKISSHAIEMDEGPGLHLGARDARDSV